MFVFRPPDAAAALLAVSRLPEVELQRAGEQPRPEAGPGQPRHPQPPTLHPQQDCRAQHPR